MSLGIIVSDTIVSTVEVGVAVYNEILGDPANDPEIVANSRRDMKRTRRRIPQSLVRRVAQTLPMKPEPRLKIPITRFQEEYGISVSNNGKYSVSPFEDTSWLYEEEGHINSSYRTHKWTPNPYPKDFIQRWELRPPTRSRRSSNNEDLDSGLDSVSVCTKTSEVAEERVAALESELASLKAMMASIALAQMQPTAASTPATDKTQARTAAPPPAPPVPAPPPPPPASAPGFKPSVPPSKKSNKLPEIHENKVSEPGPADLADVLKDVGKQKARLKSVEKSPGGTPIRRQPKPCNPQDPSTILANALKQKFVNTPTSMNESTDCEKSFNDSHTS